MNKKSMALVALLTCIAAVVLISSEHTQTPR